jgi:hypothetical protein
VLIGALATQAAFAQSAPTAPAPASQAPAVPTPAEPPPTTAPEPATTPAAPVAAPAQTPPVQAAPAQGSTVQQVPGRRRAIGIMEAVLSRAVLGGAEQLAEQLGRGNPNMSFFTGQARARGLMLDGYGVLFQVEVPEMQTSLVMSVATLERDGAIADTLDSLRRAMDSVPDSAAKLQMEQAIKRLQMQVGPLSQLNEPPPARGMIRATETSTLSDPIVPVPMPMLRDPTSVYREAIKGALIDAMLDHSRGLNIQPDEWLTVAAQRGDSPLEPNEIITSTTLVLRIKGSDLALYEADRTRKDEIRARVDVREF